MSSADEVRAYSARVEGGFRSARGYRPTPYDRSDRFAGRLAGRGRAAFARGESVVRVGCCSVALLDHKALLEVRDTCTNYPVTPVLVKTSTHPVLELFLLKVSSKLILLILLPNCEIYYGMC